LRFKTRKPALYSASLSAPRTPFLLRFKTRKPALYSASLSAPQTVCSLMAQEKQMSASQPPISFAFQDSQTRALQRFFVCSADGLLVNGARKTNVCFAAACFSFALIIS
ncbi:MAG: hypothetical protein ACI4E5_07070, partial [Suilimivivens sp.]